MSVVDVTTHTTTFHLKSGLFQTLHLHVVQPKLSELLQQLDHKIQQAPKFFQHAAVVLDLSNTPDPEHLSIPDVVAALRQRQMVPMGVRGGTIKQHQQALQQGLAQMAEPHHKNTSATHPSSSSLSARGTAQHARVITQPVRSGQRLEAPEGDLVVMASVGHGAELLAAGHIHVYGALRGRALAGMNGDTQARLFCQRMEAELVSIAGHYANSEALKNECWQHATCVALQGRRLQFSKLCDTK